MVYKVNDSRLRKHGPILFVSVGMFVIFASVVQIQNANYLTTRADVGGAEVVNSWGAHFEPSELSVGEDGRGSFKVKLGALSEVITHSRLVLDYDESQVKILNVNKGSLFDDVVTQIGLNRSVLSSSGNVFGEGTWVRLDVELTSGVDEAVLKVNRDLSEVIYDNGESLQFNGDVVVRRL